MLAEMAMAVSTAFYGTLLLQAYVYYARKSSDNSPLLPLITTYFNAALWCKYGLLNHERPLVFVNAFGMVCALIAMAAFYRFTVDKGGVEWVLWRALIVFAIFNYAVYQSWVGVEGVGKVAAVFAVLVYLIPLVHMQKLFLAATQYPGLGELVRVGDIVNPAIGSMSCALWSVFGWNQSDRWIVIPNAFGFLFCTCQVAFLLHLKQKNVF